MHKHKTKTKMAETCKTHDTLVLNSGVAKHMPSRAQALPNACCDLPPSLQKIKIL